MEWIETSFEDSTHTEIKIGSHIETYANYVAKQYIGVPAKRRYLKKQN